MRVLIAANVALWLAAVTAQATVLLPADLGDLAREAQAIVRGRVDAVQGQWAADHHGIETIVTLVVESSLKGSLPGAVQFRVPGGRVDHYRTVLVGAPSFTPGDRVVVFLGSSGPAIPHVLGLSQGVFRIVSPAGGAPVVIPPAVMPSSTTVPVVRGERAPLALSDFEQKLRDLVAGAAR